MWTYLRNHRNPLLLALLSGALLSLSFPKTDQGWLAWFALVPLLVALRQADVRTGWVLGLVAGLAHFLGLIYWTAYTMNVYGGVPLVEALCVLLLLASILAMFPAVFATSVCLVCHTPLEMLLLGPGLWVLSEWLRIWLFTGFPWELLGYSQHANLWLLQSADLFGVLGVSGLILFGNAFVCLAILHWRGQTWQTHAVGRSLVLRGGALLAGLLLFAAAYGLYRLHTVEAQIAQAPKARMAVIQGNIDQAHKWDTRFQRQTAVKYRDLSIKAAKDSAELIIWPETATPFYLYHDEELTDIVLQGVRAAHTYFIVGSPSAERSGNVFLYYNRAYLLSPEAAVIGKYDKVHLVPFGEYVPLKRWLPFLGKMVAQVGDFASGHQGNTLVWKTHPIGMLICYEVIFPELARAMTQNGAQLLVNITNDAWYGRTSAAYQNFSMTAFRAVENRRFLVRSANTGISGFIDPCGRILADTALYEDATLTADVALLSGRTLYSRWGDGPLVALCALLVVLCVVRRRVALRRSHPA
jgi:apolipoprotein N-acyltransferase